MTRSSSWGFDFDRPDHVDDLLAECDVTRTRRGGPGGQHRNKVETAVVLVHRRTGLRAEASERRSQAENLVAALFRLRIELALAERRPVPAGAVPSTLWRSRTVGGRLAVRPSHPDFPALLAEALDAVHAEGDNLKAAARRLGVTTSQLRKFLELEPRALAPIQAARRARGEHTWK